MPTFTETLDFLYSQLPMYQRVGKAAVKKGLGNTRRLLKALDNPHKKFPSIHIAGTNGKGTTSHMLASCYQAAGYKTGLYTSPHYSDFRERVRINGEMIGKREVVRFVERIKPALEDFAPSFFEITVAMAFDAFARHEVDIAIVETGLGGRLDSTNVILPELSVITNIGFDHMDMLGDTLPKIAREKAGIIKPGVPVVVGEWNKETAPVFKKVASQRKARLSYADRTLNTRLLEADYESSRYRVEDRRGELIGNFRLDVAGPYQGKNLVTAVKAMQVLSSLQPNLAISTYAMRKGLSSIRTSTGYKGRWQVLATNPLVLADSAHNAEGLNTTLNAIRKKHSRVHFVLGFANDKPLDEILGLFPEEALYFFAKPAVPRGLDAGKLEQKASEHGLRGKAYRSVRSALAAAKKTAAPGDLIYVGGSSFVVAEVV